VILHMFGNIGSHELNDDFSNPSVSESMGLMGGPRAYIYIYIFVTIPMAAST
jgi:hypothetical protein